MAIVSYRIAKGKKSRRRRKESTRPYRFRVGKQPDRWNTATCVELTWCEPFPDERPNVYANCPRWRNVYRKLDTRVSVPDVWRRWAVGPKRPIHLRLNCYPLDFPVRWSRPMPRPNRSTMTTNCYCCWFVVVAVVVVAVRSIAGVGVVAMPVRTTLKRLPLVVVAAGRDEPTMEGDCADVASTTKILLNFHSSHPILRLKKKNSKLTTFKWRRFNAFFKKFSICTQSPSHSNDPRKEFKTFSALFSVSMMMIQHNTHVCIQLVSNEIWLIFFCSSWWKLGCAGGDFSTVVVLLLLFIRERKDDSMIHVCCCSSSSPTLLSK